MRQTLRPLFLIISLSVLFQCGSVKPNEEEALVRNMLLDLNRDLKTLSSTAILKKYFSHTKRSKEALGKVVDILKNRDSLQVISKMDFNNITYTAYKEYTDVIVNGVLETAGDEGKFTIKTVLHFDFQKIDNVIVITDFDGQDYYRDYLHVKNEKLWALERIEELKARQPYYDTAKQLQAKFDSVLWYWTHAGKTYYTVVQGEWDLATAFDGYEKDYKMGVVNAKGDTLVPIEYTLVGTLGFPFADLMEIHSDGSIGYFSLKADSVVIAPEFSTIIPYDQDTVFALAITNLQVAGWINKEFKFTEGELTPAATKYIDEYLYLQQKVVLKKDNQILAEIPAKEHAGSGIIVPPDFYVASNLFPHVIQGIRTTKVPMNGWTDQIENNSIINRISEGIRAIVTVIGERYVGGRESFYGESSVQLLDERDTVLAAVKFATDGDIVFSHPDPFLLELKANSLDYLVYAPGNERGLPEYKYFQISAEGTLTELESRRLFTFTEFVKIDSSYIMGPFLMRREVTEEEVVEEEPVAETEESEEVTDESTEESEGEQEEEYYYEEDYSDEDDLNQFDEVEFLTDESVRYMIDEIYAAYGYLNPYPSYSADLERRFYIDKAMTAQQAEQKFSAIDIHNVAFLKRYLDAKSEQSNL